MTAVIHEKSAFPPSVESPARRCPRCPRGADGKRRRLVHGFQREWLGRISPRCKRCVVRGMVENCWCCWMVACVRGRVSGRFLGGVKKVGPIWITATETAVVRVGLGGSELMTAGRMVRPYLRPASWTGPAGGSPAPVGTGAPGSRPRFVVERRRAERGVESLFGGRKCAGRNVKRTLQPRQTHNGRAEPLMSRRRPCPASPVPGSARRVCSAYGRRHVHTVWFGT